MCKMCFSHGVGMEAPFVAEHFKKAIESSGRYECACPLTWTNLHSQGGGTPVSTKAVLDLIDQLKGDYPIDNIVVAVDNSNYDVAKNIGKLARLSPEEPEHAAILQARSVIESGDNKALEKLVARWRSTTFIFEKVGSDVERFWRQMQLREKITGVYEAVAPTPISRMINLMLFKMRMEKTNGVLSASELSQEWQTHSGMSKSAEQVTEDWVKLALKIWADVWQKTSLRNKIMVLEDTYGKDTPLDSLYKLKVISSKCSSNTDMMEWTLDRLAWCLAHNGCQPRDFTVTALSGRGHGNRGLVDVFICQHAIQQWLFNVYVEEKAYCVEFKSLLRGLANHNDMAKRVFDTDGKKNIAWMGTMLPHERALIEWYQVALSISPCCY